MKLQIKNVRAVLPDGILDGAVVGIENERIVFIGKDCRSDYETVDGHGAYLLAGFIDMHCHGGANFDFMDASADEMLEISRHHLMHGTTTLFATTMTDTWEATERALDTYAALVDRGELLTLEGVHLEGPWLAPSQCGAQPIEKMDTPSVSKFEKLLEKYPFIKRVSVAPELPGGMEVGRYGESRGVVMSAGHTDADFDTVIEASKNGYSLLTHFYSGMAGVVRKNAYRVAGAIEAGYYCDDLDVEIIADGKHLPASLLKLICKCCGTGRVSLITDAMRASGLSDGESSVIGRLDDGVPVIVEDGVAKLLDRTAFAGSVATTDRLVRTMRELAGCDIVEISRMASANPARVMGLDDRGTIEVGKRADLVLMNEALQIEKIIFKGEII